MKFAARVASSGSWPGRTNPMPNLYRPRRLHARCRQRWSLRKSCCTPKLTSSVETSSSCLVKSLTTASKRESRPGRTSPAAERNVPSQPERDRHRAEVPGVPRCVRSRCGALECGTASRRCRRRDALFSGEGVRAAGNGAQRLAAVSLRRRSRVPAHDARCAADTEGRLRDDTKHVAATRPRARRLSSSARVDSGHQAAPVTEASPEMRQNFVNARDPALRTDLGRNASRHFGDLVRLLIP